MIQRPEVRCPRAASCIVRALVCVALGLLVVGVGAQSVRAASPTLVQEDLVTSHASSYPSANGWGANGDRLVRSSNGDLYTTYVADGSDSDHFRWVLAKRAAAGMSWQVVASGATAAEPGNPPAVLLGPSGTVYVITISSWNSAAAGAPQVWDSTSRTTRAIPGHWLTGAAMERSGALYPAAGIDAQGNIYVWENVSCPDFTYANGTALHCQSINVPGAYYWAYRTASDGQWHAEQWQNTYRQAYDFLLAQSEPALSARARCTSASPSARGLPLGGHARGNRERAARHRPGARRRRSHRRHRRRSGPVHRRPGCGPNPHRGGKAHRVHRRRRHPAGSQPGRRPRRRQQPPAAAGRPAVPRLGDLRVVGTRDILASEAPYACPNGSGYCFDQVMEAQWSNLDLPASSSIVARGSLNAAGYGGDHRSSAEDAYVDTQGRTHVLASVVDSSTKGAYKNDQLVIDPSGTSVTDVEYGAVPFPNLSRIVQDTTGTFWIYSVGPGPDGHRCMVYIASASGDGTQLGPATVIPFAGSWDCGAEERNFDASARAGTARSDYIDGVLPTNGGLDWVHYRIALPTGPALGPSITALSQLPDATADNPYRYQLAASGGQPPYTWSIPTGGAGPPAGMSLASDGTLSGTPPTNPAWNIPGSFTITVQVTDAGGHTTTGNLGLTVR
jgi:Putative Ig domain